MLAISLFCAALGVAVGTRFKILVLGPAFVLALVSNISFGIAAGWGFREMAATLLISLVALQVGYLAGSLVSHFVLDGPFQARDRLDASLSPLGPTGLATAYELNRLMFVAPSILDALTYLIRAHATAYRQNNAATFHRRSLQ